MAIIWQFENALLFDGSASFFDVTASFFLSLCKPLESFFPSNILIYSKKKSKGEMTMKEVPIWEKINLTIEEAAALSNIGLGKLREITNDPRCPFVLCIGRKKLIKRKEFTDYLSKRLEI